MSDKVVQITDPATNKTAALPVVSGTRGDPAFDIGKLNKDTGYFTFDPGFMATAATRSAVTFIDGDKGVLLYRGYPIDQLAKNSSFLEVAYLLINGELPSQAQFSSFEHEITHHTMMHEALKNFLHGFHYDAHPMAMLCASIASAVSTCPLTRWPCQPGSASETSIGVRGSRFTSARCSVPSAPRAALPSTARRLP